MGEANKANNIQKLADIQHLAEECLEEGCSIFAVNELVAQLKNQKSNPQIEEAIQLLEKEVLGYYVDQKQVNELVSAVSTRMPNVADTISDVDDVLQLSNAVTTCLEDGCSIPTVEDLVAKYKAQNIPDEGLANKIEQLEVFLEKQQTKQNVIQKVLED